MIVSIIALFFLTKSIARLALQKNEPTGKWKWKVIGAWIAGDLLGEMLIFYFFGLNLPLLALFGISLGFVGYLIVKKQLENLPDVPNSGQPD